MGSTESKMDITCLSDLHGHYPKLEGGDLLILGGDYTASDQFSQYLSFFEWLKEQKYRKKIFISGNHDNQAMSQFDLGPDTEYLLDSGTEFEGLKIWGSPWTSRFEGINPHCCAFTGENDEELVPKFDLIPKDVDILITHSPPFTVRDKIINGPQVGSLSLMANHIDKDGFRPKLWVFGHIHEAYGQEGPYKWNNTKYVNASHVNEKYEPVNKPIRMEL